MDKNQKDILLRLLLLDLPGWGSVSVNRLLESNDSGELDAPVMILDAIKVLSENHARIKLPDIKDIERARGFAENLIQQCEIKGIQILTPANNFYPVRLDGIKRLNPVVIFARGDLTVLNQNLVVAVIGTRKPEPWVYQYIKRIGIRCAESGAIVLSGLAAGCDTAAHEGCLEVQGRAIGVLGNAIDTIYPEENRPLAEVILSCGGCIVSEYAPGVRMNKYQLVTRDRLQAAMSDSIIVGQTDQTGGSMHAANFAIDDISRPVGVLSVDNCNGAAFSGNTDLLGRGATPITNADDLLAFISRSRINDEGGAILFDLDQTLIDSSKLEKKRQARQWDWILSNLELIQPREGIENLLNEIEVTGLSIGLVTSAPRHYADTVCQRFGWTFDTVVSYHDTHFHKPHPNPLLKAASNLDLDPQNCICIGDDEKDQIAARRAGMHFFHISKEGMNGESLKNFLEQSPGRLDK